ncbi:MAG TPA: aminotransferase class V-fold PLP-dependent enzyme [Methylocella sp.]|nr:aminotransferase class V-fold PLP-dependent enzyme [Methylocella sp.]
MSEIEMAVAALAAGELQEVELRRHIDPLFSRVLREAGGQIYLANHSLGRPLDRIAADVEEGLSFWYGDLDRAWANWQAEMVQFRSRVATLIHAPGAHCIVPKASAGQGLRAVLNCHDALLRVIATRNEFNSIDLILKAYAARGRIKINWVESHADRHYRADNFATALRAGADLLVVSMVFFDTGQLLTEIDAIVGAAKACGARVLVDLYHAAGALPVDVQALDIDFAIGGAYKYLRGGPGAAWLYVHPRHLEGPLRTLDTGWFATREPLAFKRPERPSFAPGAEGWLESTPAVLPYYQARAGLEFTLATGVERLRAFSLKQQANLADRLAEKGIAILGAGLPHGAFIAISTPKAEAATARLLEGGVVADAREGLLRLCPDILNPSQELLEAAGRVAHVLRNV